MKIDINVVHFVGVIILGVIAITLVLTHQTSLLGAIIHIIVGMIGMSFVPAALRIKTPIEKIASGDFVVYKDTDNIRRIQDKDNEDTK